MGQKIPGKFYPLKSEEWLDNINQLTHSELKILYYIRSLDPYNNGINLTTAQIARDLSTEKHEMHRSTVGRALKSLDKKGFINMELLKVRIKVNPKGFLSETEIVETKNNVVATQQCCDTTTQVVTPQHDVQPDNMSCDTATQVVTPQQSSAENLSEQSFQNPKTFKTYSDFIKTLSVRERDDFFDFVKEATRNLTKPINDIEAWLANKTTAGQNRWEVYYTNFKEFKQLNQPKRVEKPHRQNALAKWQAELEERRKQAEQNWEQEQNNA